MSARLFSISIWVVATYCALSFAPQAYATSPLFEKPVCERHGYSEMAHIDEARVFVRQNAKEQLEAEGWTCGAVSHDILTCPGIDAWDYSSGVLFELAICNTNTEPKYALFYVIHKIDQDGRLEIGEPHAIYVDPAIENAGEAL